MSYNLRAYIEHEDLQGTLHRLELLKWDYVGDPHEMTGDGDARVHRFEHEVIGAEGAQVISLYENPIIKGRLEIYPLIQSDADLDILKEIHAASENDFLAVWKQDGSTEWTGTPKIDLLEYPEDAYPFQGTITAKDFNKLDGIDYKPGGSLPDGKKTMIEVLAELLAYTDYGCQIKTATSWIEEQGNSALDYLQQNQIDIFALRHYAKAEGESDEAMSVGEALRHVLADNKMILKQAGNLFLVDQLSEHEDATSVFSTLYDTAGSQISASNEDRSITTGPGLTITGQSKNRFYGPLKRVRTTFNHRTKLQLATLPDEVVLSGGSESFTFFFGSDGNQQIRLRGTIEATLPDGSSGTATANLRINPGSYWWDGASWVDGSIQSVGVTLHLIGPDGDGGYVYRGSYDITTDTAPPDAEPDLDISFFSAAAGATSADQTVWEPSLEIINPQAEADSTSLDFQLTQQGGYSTSYVHKPDALFGDGPAPNSPAKITRASDGSMTFDSWARRGQASFVNFHENGLKEIMDTQRGGPGILELDCEGIYDASKDLAYDGASWFYIGGRFDGYDGIWNPVVVRVSVTPDAGDSFETLIKNSGEGGAATSGSPSSTSEGDYYTKTQLDGGQLDNRYYTQTELDGGQLDNRYYTEAELDGGQLDGRYYTETEVNNLLEGKLDTNVPISSNTGDTGAVNLSSGESLRILAGTDISTSVTQGTGGVEVTVNYTGSAGSDTFVNGGIFESAETGGLDGDNPGWDPAIKLTRTSGVDTFVDLRPLETWADARYALDGHSHSHFSSTSNPHGVTAAQAGAVPTSRTVTAGTGLSGGGPLSSNITINMDHLMNQNVRTSDSPTFVDVTTTSDRRVKDIHGPLSNALGTVRNITGYRGEKNGKPGIFYIAQEIENVIDGVVEKKALHGYDDFRVMNNMSMQVVNTMAIKEVDIEVENLRRQIESLTKRVMELRGGL